MHNEILSPKQKQLLPLLKQFSGKYGLVGGTAIALQLGHRHSIDFDLFSHSPINHQEIRDIIRQEYPIGTTLVENKKELTILVNGVKLTFYQYPFLLNYFEDIDHSEEVDYLPGFGVTDEEIKKKLLDHSLTK